MSIVSLIFAQKIVLNILTSRMQEKNANFQTTVQMSYTMVLYRVNLRRVWTWSVKN